MQPGIRTLAASLCASLAVSPSTMPSKITRPLTQNAVSRNGIAPRGPFHGLSPLAERNDRQTGMEKALPIAKVGLPKAFCEIPALPC